MVSENEIAEAVKALPMGKAPGIEIDGFGASFFRTFWSTVKGEITAAIAFGFSTNHFPCSWKKTIIALVPKTESPAKASEFRPISLCSFLYKTKI